MNILVTGGAGFLGSHLCERLLALGDNVCCFDDLSTGHMDNIAPLLANPRFDVQRGDIARFTSATRYEVIFNLASPASPKQYQRAPVQVMRSNVLGALAVLDHAHATHARVIQASTSEVYGDPAVHPQPETYCGEVNCIGPRACYDESKRAAETLFADYRRQFGVDTRIARIFNTYGPRMAQDDGRVVSNFIVQALRGEALTIYGDGQQTRSFCYVDDLIEGLVALRRDGLDGTPINLGNPSEISVRDLGMLVFELTGKTPRWDSRPLPQDDPARRQPDIKKARQVLGWQPKVGLREGLEKTVAYFKARYFAANS